MRVGIVSPFEESVPPKSYGGTELVIDNLIRGLLELGVDVDLIATGDSNTKARLFPVFPESLRSKDALFKHRERYKYIATGRVLDILAAHSFDLVHNHLGWRLLPFEKHISQPLVTTLHGQLTTEDQQVCFSDFKASNYISISYNQRKGMPDLNYVSNVYNGIDVNRFTVGGPDRSYLAFLGRMSPEKGPAEAIQIAKRSNKVLRMAAKIDSTDREYFERELKPQIDGKQIIYIGEVNHEQKVEFLGKASALLMPIQWEEPFGLVNVEAFACGTPVIGLKRGSLPELIDDGKVGYLCADIDEMVKRVDDLQHIDPQACRRHVEEKFSSRRMAKDYLNTYKNLQK